MASITKIAGKNGISYKIMCSMGYDIHGRQIRKTCTFTPPPNVAEGKGRKLAEAFAHDFEKRCRGVSDLGENIRFKDLMLWYYSEIAPNVIREGTIYDQKVLLNLYVVEEFGHLKLKDITTARLDELWNRLKKDGGRREYYAFRDKDVIPLGSRRETAKAAGLTENIVYRACTGEKITKSSAEKISTALGKPFKEIFELVYEKGGLSSATVSHIRATMSAIMRTAVKKGLLEKNPVVNTTPPKPDNKKKLFLDSGQCKQLLDIFEGIENRQLRVMIGGEFLPAGWTCEAIHSPFLNRLRVACPPLDTALIRAKLALLHSGNLQERFPAFAAVLIVGNATRSRKRPAEALPPAEGFDRIRRNFQLDRYFLISPATLAESRYSFFLFICQELSSNPRTSVLITHRNFSGRLNEK